MARRPAVGQASRSRSTRSHPSTSPNAVDVSRERARGRTARSGRCCGGGLRRQAGGPRDRCARGSSPTTGIAPASATDRASVRAGMPAAGDAQASEDRLWTWQMVQSWLSRPGSWLCPNAAAPCSAKASRASTPRIRWQLRGTIASGRYRIFRVVGRRYAGEPRGFLLRARIDDHP